MLTLDIVLRNVSKNFAWKYLPLSCVGLYSLRLGSSTDIVLTLGRFLLDEWGITNI